MGGSALVQQSEQRVVRQERKGVVATPQTGVGEQPILNNPHEREACTSCYEEQLTERYLPQLGGEAA